MLPQIWLRFLFHSFADYVIFSGSRSSALNFEASSISTRLPSRKCIIMMISEFSNARFRELIAEGAGALLVFINQLIIFT